MDGFWALDDFFKSFFTFAHFLVNGSFFSREELRLSIRDYSESLETALEAISKFFFQFLHTQSFRESLEKFEFFAKPRNFHLIARDVTSDREFSHFRHK